MEIILKWILWQQLAEELTLLQLAAAVTNYALNMTNFALNMMNFVFTLMNVAFNMTDVGVGGPANRAPRFVTSQDLDRASPLPHPI